MCPGERPLVALQFTYVIPNEGQKDSGVDECSPEKTALIWATGGEHVPCGPYTASGRQPHLGGTQDLIHLKQADFPAVNFIWARNEVTNIQKAPGRKKKKIPTLMGSWPLIGPTGSNLTNKQSKHVGISTLDSKEATVRWTRE